MLAGAWQGIVIEKTRMKTIVGEVEEVDAADVAACKVTALAQVPAAKEAEPETAAVHARCELKVALTGEAVLTVEAAAPGGDDQMINGMPMAGQKPTSANACEQMVSTAVELCKGSAEQQKVAPNAYEQKVGANAAQAKMPSAMKVPLKGDHMAREQASCI